jgi:hypothetical protein
MRPWRRLSTAVPVKCWAGVFLAAVARPLTRHWNKRLSNPLGVLQPVSSPLALRSDNSRFFSSRHHTATVRAYGLRQGFTALYTPKPNGLMERFFRALKEKCIWQHRLESWGHAREANGRWIRCYNGQWASTSIGLCGTHGIPRVKGIGRAKTWEPFPLVPRLAL